MHRFQLVLHVFRRCVMGLFSVKSKKEAKRSKGKTSARDARKGGVTIYLFLSLSPTSIQSVPCTPMRFLKTAYCSSVGSGHPFSSK